MWYGCVVLVMFYGCVGDDSRYSECLFDELLMMLGSKIKNYVSHIQLFTLTLIAMSMYLSTPYHDLKTEPYILNCLRCLLVCWGCVYRYMGRVARVPLKEAGLRAG